MSTAAAPLAPATVVTWGVMFPIENVPTRTQKNTCNQKLTSKAPFILRGNTFLRNEISHDSYDIKCPIEIIHMKYQIRYKTSILV